MKKRNKKNCKSTYKKEELQEPRVLSKKEEEEERWKEIDKKNKNNPLYDPVRARLYDAAQRASNRGDEASYCGYMSALGDVGR